MREQFILQPTKGSPRTGNPSTRGKERQSGVVDIIEIEPFLHNIANSGVILVAIRMTLYTIFTSLPVALFYLTSDRTFLPDKLYDHFT